MEWTDKGIILSADKHGETSAIIEILTSEHGRHKGLVRGGSGRRLRGVLQPGNEVSATWRARLAEHLGHFTVESSTSRAAILMEDRIALAALGAVCAVAAATLPEREPHKAVYDAFIGVLDGLEDCNAGQAAALVARWELGLLSELGFRLDLSRCAVTGEKEGLRYVSPRSGRAVSESAAGPYRDRLLPLPSYLLGKPAANLNAGEGLAGLELTGFFIARYLLAPHDKSMPSARRRFLEQIRNMTTRSGCNSQQ